MTTLKTLKDIDNLTRQELKNNAIKWIKYDIKYILSTYPRDEQKKNKQQIISNIIRCPNNQRWIKRFNLTYSDLE